MISDWDGFLTKEEMEEAQWVRNWAARTVLMSEAVPDSEKLKAELRREFSCMCQCMEEAETGGGMEKFGNEMKLDIEQILGAFCRFSRNHDFCLCPQHRAVRLVEKYEEAQKNKKIREREENDGYCRDEEETETDLEIGQLLDGICRFSRRHSLCQCPYYRAIKAEEELREMWMRGEDLPY